MNEHIFMDGRREPKDVSGNVLESKNKTTSLLAVKSMYAFHIHYDHESENGWKLTVNKQRVVSLSLSPSCVARKKTARK